jgi:type IV pilus assembly protein PilF
MKAWVPALLAACLPLTAAVAAPTAQDEAPMVTAARLNAQLAVAYLKQNDIAVAREKIEKALTQNPKDATVQMSAGLVFERLQDAERADRHYATALKLEPGNPDVQNIYAVFQCRNGRPVQGQKGFEQVARNPAYSTPEVAYANAGVCARGAGDLARAEAFFRKALKVRPDFPDALLQLADLTYTTGGGLGARALLERYFRVAPASADALMLGVRIERALGDVEAATRYQNQLQKDFPDSEQARELRSRAGTP